MSLFVHASNINSKIKSNYNGKAEEPTQFRDNCYIPFRDAMLNIDFNSSIHPIDRRSIGLPTNLL